MIKIENVQVVGFEAAMRGMRNPLNSWSKSDSVHCLPDDEHTMPEECITCDDNCPLAEDDWCFRHEPDDTHFYIGPKDLELAKKLASNGPVHAKYRRMMTVYLDITAPRYWWAEMDTYKVGTVANSCSTMHKIHSRDLTLDDFSCEDLPAPEPGKSDEFSIFTAITVDGGTCLYSPKGLMQMTIKALNNYRKKFIETKDKKWWRMMIQTLPSSYNQKRTVMLNYEVLTGIYKHRKDHKLSEWREFCKWIEGLPYSELITGESKEDLECQLTTP